MRFIQSRRTGPQRHGRGEVSGQGAVERSVLLALVTE